MDFDRLAPQPDAPVADAGALLAQFYRGSLVHEWGDVGDGLLNWFIRPSRLAAGDLRATGFVWGNG
ncbi:hypothetical protein [Streptomyces sp. BK340]|uniref:hypothetical protein n=1 Tax=Streptomyces sp. BK340 TaxID=2572903 RepID=UPI0011A50653|nr:hypothetical protein [Streptomyces sp. BK340]